MRNRSITAAVFGLLAFFAQGSWAAFLGINETPTGVVFSGDGNFTANDWQGLISSTQTGTENARLSANLFNPNGGPGSAIIRIWTRTAVIRRPYGFFPRWCSRRIHC